MLMKNNLLECVTLISCSVCFICIFLNCLTDISPITGIWFSLYIILVFILSMSFSFKFIQWLLHMNKPIKYDLEGLFKEYPQFLFLKPYLPQVKRKDINEEFDEGKEYDTNELSVISSVLERKLVSSWYVPYISQEIGFPFACKQLLDQMIGKTFKICNKIETKEVFVDTCSILTSHLREYKKALKRHEKSPASSIESLYKKTHPISEKKMESAEHCTNILRIILKELVPWELWDTPHSELLVRILSKRLDGFIDSTLADPVWINDKLMNIIDRDAEYTAEEVAEKIKPEVVDKNENDNQMMEMMISTVAVNSVAPILQKDIAEELTAPVPCDSDNEPVPAESELTSPSEAPVLRQRRGRQREVKIYDRIVEGSVKTWTTDMDLHCISMGQDLLASLDGGVMSRLWPDPDHDHSPDKNCSKEPPLWFGEEETLELETDSPQKSPVKKEHSPKPVELLKELQTTVNSAKTKIGGLQVPIRSIDVRPNVSAHVLSLLYAFFEDEAAGMMEGLLDFGIAGLKKGLRFTGLSDDSQDKSPSHTKDHSARNSPPDVGGRTRPIPIEPREPIISSVIQREDNGSTVPQLVKQHRVASQDSVPSIPKPIPHAEPLAPLTDSPEPEYEEAADLSASIAKLRSLLQRAEGSPERAEEIWWEGAEETRGRTHHHHSSRPVDTATLADEYDMHMDRNSSPSGPSNRLDKLFQRTVTGVFNSIKTAVGAEGDEIVPPQPLPEWTYVCTSIELSVGGAVARLVGSRRAHAHVDCALDSLEHLAPPPAGGDIVPEDFDEWCCVYGGGMALAQLASAGGLGASHAAHRLATLLLADVAEPLIETWLAQLAAWLRQQIFVVFDKMAAEGDDPAPRARRPRDLRATRRAVMARIPALCIIFGEEALSEAVNLSISSFSHQELNKDVIFRVLDLFAVHFKKSAGLRNPSFDTN